MPRRGGAGGVGGRRDGGGPGGSGGRHGRRGGDREGDRGRCDMHGFSVDPATMLMKDAVVL